MLRANFAKQTGSAIFPCEMIPTLTPTPNGPSATATNTRPPGSSACTCDCDDDGQVSINDLVRSVLVALGSLQLSECSGMADAGTLTVPDLVRGVRNALDGCS